jgi:hypothetical protein
MFAKIFSTIGIIIILLFTDHLAYSNLPFLQSELSLLQIYSIIYLTLMGLVGLVFIAQILIDKIWKE